ncbi:phosphotransferase family protein [Mycolicibacterium sp.]|uniref:phosphotransferase family protein n=1 Tax=Mycolicibacterium sp. TaxID=2320850 RepID=UPI00356053BE
MALLNKVDPRAVAEQLAAWLPTGLSLPGPVRVRDMQMPVASGMSSETILFEADWEEAGELVSRGMVARIPPSGEGLFPDYNIGREGRVMTAIARHTKAAVPKVLATDLEGSALGAPFLLLERVYGSVPSDDPPFVTGGWVVDLAPEQRNRMYDNALRAISDIQTVEPARAGLEDLRREQAGDTALAQDFAHWKQFYAWAANDRTSPTIDAAVKILSESIPSGPHEEVVSWGDARLGNMMFDSGQRVTGVFDWELATLGPRELDLGFFLFFDRMYASGLGLPRLEGFPERGAAIGRFEELIETTVKHIDWYEAFGALRGAILLLRVGNLMIDLGLIPADAEMPLNNPAAQTLAALLELPPPAGTSGWITGNR